MLRVIFRNIREIRMGSPYNVCEVEFCGDWLPPLDDHDWQDIKAESPDGRYLALVQWDSRGNSPGFHVVRIDSKRRRLHRTKRIEGVCVKLVWNQGRFRWTKLLPE